MKNIITRRNVKVVVQIAAAIAVSYVVKDIIKNNTSNPEGTADAAKLIVGTLVLSAMVATATDQHVAASFDSIFKPVETNNITSAP